MTSQAKSGFQMFDFQVADFKYSNRIFHPVEELMPHWEMTAQKFCQYDKEQKRYVGTLMLDISCTAGSAEAGLEIRCAPLAQFTFESEESDDAQTRMDKLLSLNGMFQLLGLVRPMLLLQAGILQMPIKCCIPSINLNKFVFGEKISF